MREKISLQELMKLKGTECQKHNILTFLALASFYNGQENGGVILYFFILSKVLLWSPEQCFTSWTHFACIMHMNLKLSTFQFDCIFGHTLNGK